MIKNIFVFLFFCFPVFGQVALKKGETAKQDGVFFTIQEAAELIADKEVIEKQSELEIEYTKKELEIKHEAEIRKLNSKLEIVEEKNKMVLELKQKQIDNLYKELEERSKDYSMLWLIGGVVAGTTTAILIFFAATQTEKAPYLLSGD